MTDALAQWLAAFCAGMGAGIIVGNWLMGCRIREKARNGTRLACGDKLYEIRVAKGWEDR